LPGRRLRRDRLWRPPGTRTETAQVCPGAVGAYTGPGRNSGAPDKRAVLRLGRRN